MIHTAIGVVDYQMPGGDPGRCRIRLVRRSRSAYAAAASRSTRAQRPPRPARVCGAASGDYQVVNLSEPRGFRTSTTERDYDGTFEWTPRATRPKLGLAGLPLVPHRNFEILSGATDRPCDQRQQRAALRVREVLRRDVGDSPRRSTRSGIRLRRRRWQAPTVGRWQPSARPTFSSPGFTVAGGRLRRSSQGRGPGGALFVRLPAPPGGGGPARRQRHRTQGRPAHDRRRRRNGHRPGLPIRHAGERRRLQHVSRRSGWSSRRCCRTCWRRPSSDVPGHGTAGRPWRACQTSCHECMRDYGNLAYHSILDWRLAVDMARLALDRRRQSTSPRPLGWRGGSCRGARPLGDARIDPDDARRP